MQRSLGFALTLLIAVAALVAGAILFSMLDAPFDAIIEATLDNTEGANAETGVGWVETSWMVLPFVVVGLLVLGLVARASVRGGLT